MRERVKETFDTFAPKIKSELILLVNISILANNEAHEWTFSEAYLGKIWKYFFIS